jgi:hypothetical protein
MTHWSDPYVGQPFDYHAANCADLAVRVQAEQFGRRVRVAGCHSPRPDVTDAAILDQMHAACREVREPADGDGVLLSNGNHLHVGLYCCLDEPHVLHALAGAGVVRHRLRQIGRYGFAIEGYYRWR